MHGDQAMYEKQVAAQCGSVQLSSHGRGTLLRCSAPLPVAMYCAVRPCIHVAFFLTSTACASPEGDDCASGPMAAAPVIGLGRCCGVTRVAAAINPSAPDGPRESLDPRKVEKHTDNIAARSE